MTPKEIITIIPIKRLYIDRQLRGALAIYVLIRPEGNDWLELKSLFVYKCLRSNDRLNGYI